MDWCAVHNTLSHRTSHDNFFVITRAPVAVVTIVIVVIDVVVVIINEVAVGASPSSSAVGDNIRLVNVRFPNPLGGNDFGDVQWTGPSLARGARWLTFRLTLGGVQLLLVAVAAWEEVRLALVL